MRWGIETAHRCEDKFRIPTTCKTAEVRYLFFVVSVLLYNLWVWINLFFNFSTSDEHVTIAGFKELMRKTFEEFNLWLKSPERWLSMLSFGNARKAFLPIFDCL